MRRFFLILLGIGISWSLLAQGRVSEAEQDRLYWESVLDAYSAFVEDAVLVKENQASTDILRLHQEKISRLLKNRRGKMTPEQKARFDAISARYRAQGSGEGIVSEIFDNQQENAGRKNAGRSVKTRGKGEMRDFAASPGMTSGAVSEITRKEIALVESKPWTGRPIVPEWASPAFVPTLPQAGAIPARQDDKSSWKGVVLAQAGIVPEWTAGAMAGSWHPSGWGAYASFRFHPATGLEDAYTVVSEASFRATGAYQTRHLSVTAGVLKTVGPVLLYAGPGYAYRNVYWEDHEGRWARMEARSVAGFTLEAGVLFPLGPVCIGAGISTIAFRTLGGSLALGLNF